MQQRMERVRRIYDGASEYIRVLHTYAKAPMHARMRGPPCKFVEITDSAFCKKRAAARGWA
jgi:hypothetical protein